MKPTCLLLFLVFSLFFGTVYSQPQSVAPSAAQRKVTVLPSLEKGKKVRLLEIEGKLFLTTQDVMKLLNPNDIASVNVLKPGAKEYKEMMQQTAIKGNLESICKIELKEGAKLPQAFQGQK